VAEDLEKRVSLLQAELETARKDNEIALEKFIADQERAFEEREREGTETLEKQAAELTDRVEMHEKAHYYQSQVADTLRKETAERRTRRLPRTVRGVLLSAFPHGRRSPS
jgi:hypothetical protein